MLRMLNNMILRLWDDCYYIILGLYSVSDRSSIFYLAQIADVFVCAEVKFVKGLCRTYFPLRSREFVKNIVCFL